MVGLLPLSVNGRQILVQVVSSRLLQVSIAPNSRRSRARGGSYNYVPYTCGGMGGGRGGVRGGGGQD